MLIDSHCHLNYLDDPDGAIERARQSGVTTCLCISVDEDGYASVKALADTHEDVWATAGVHPDAAEGNLDWIEAELSQPRVVAVGETGLDYFHAEDPAVQARQREAFAHQLDLGAKHALPVIVHTRQAEVDTLDLLRAHAGAHGVLHCFTESWLMAKQALDMGFFISISGIVTFKNADNVREVAAQVPANRLLIETDAPFLAPVPKRGKTNEPAFVAHTAAFLAELRGVDVAVLCEQTGQNFVQLFGCGQ
jgi:TatD DNase family protein